MNVKVIFECKTFIASVRYVGDGNPKYFSFLGFVVYVHENRYNIKETCIFKLGAQQQNLLPG
jgi:hypothetical protein